MSSWIQDVRHSVRQLWRQPVFTLTAVLTLAIGLGVNTVAFSVVNGLLLKDVGVDTDQDIGRLATFPGGDESGYASLAEYERFGDAVRSSLDLAAEGRLSVAWRHDAGTETAWVLFVSANYFSLVTPAPIAGQLQVARAAGGPPSAVIGERFWRDKLASASLAGLTLRLNDTLVNVAGLLPESFHGPSGIYSPDVWLPLEDVALFRTSAALRQNRDARWLFLFGRVRPGATVPEVQGHVAAAAAAMTRDWPGTHRERTARFRLFREGNSERRALGTAAAVAMGIIGLVLLLACFNVANLLLARAVERERDVAIRAAIGASAARLMRLVVTEGLIVAALAALAALVLASFTQTLVGSFAIPIDEPQYVDLTPDGKVMGFVAALALVAGVVPGLWPALSAARVNVLRVLGGHGGGSSARPTAMRRWLVGAQVAGSTAFLAVAVLFAQTYGTQTLADLGFAREELLVAEVEPASHGYDEERSEQYMQSLTSRVRSLPGVVDVAIANRAPFFIGYDELTAVSTASSPCEPSACAKHATLAVDAGYFKTMGIALTAGREFTENGGADVIVNQPLARLHWPDGGGVGETLRIGDRGTPMTVVGITASTLTRGLNRERPTLYVPIGREHFQRELSVVVRTAMEPALLVRPLTEAAAAIDRDVALRSAKPMESRIAVQLWPFRTISWLFSICGVLALVLATVGLASVVIHAVNRRIREFGIRVSIGATPRDLLIEVLRGSARLLVPGLVVGLLLAAVSAQLAKSAFVGVSVLNPAVYAGVALIETLVVFLACIAPARRAARTDPLVALRTD